MREKVKRLIRSILIQCIVLSQIGNMVYAESKVVQITGTIGPAYTVTIPSNVSFSSRSNINYTVKVIGDVSSEDYVKVSPPSTVTLKHTAGATVTPTITQNTRFSGSAISSNSGKTETGVINIANVGLTAGRWNGTVRFSISFEDNS